MVQLQTRRHQTGRFWGNNCPYLLQEALNAPSNSCSCCIWEVENGRAYRYGPQVHDDGRPRLTTDGQHTARTVTLSDSTQRGTTHRTGTTTSRQPHPAPQPYVKVVKNDTDAEQRYATRHIAVAEVTDVHTNCH